MKKNQLSLRQRLDAIADEGKEIKVTWEGGNDSGSFTVYIDGKQCEYGDVDHEEIIDKLDESLDFGSWSGDFFADGSVVYDSKEGAFIGEGRDVTSEGGTLSDISIELRVPKYLNFDRIGIHTEGSYCWDELHVRCNFIINNGPVFEEHSLTQEALNDYLIERICHILDTNEGSKDEEIGYVYNEWSITRESFDEDGEDLVYIIDELDFEFNDSNEHSYKIKIEEE